MTAQSAYNAALLTEKKKNNVSCHARLPDECVERHPPKSLLGQCANVPSPARHLTNITGNRPQRLQVCVGYESTLPVDHHTTNYASMVVPLLYFGAVKK